MIFLFLSDMRENQLGVISAINFSNSFSKRLADMGFSKGEKVECIKISTFSSPILYRVKGSNIALRRVDAKRIGVIV